MAAIMVTFIIFIISYVLHKTLRAFYKETFSKMDRNFVKWAKYPVDIKMSITMTECGSQTWRFYPRFQCVW